MSTTWPSTTEVDPTDPEVPKPRPGRSYWLGRQDYLHAARLQETLLRERMAGHRPDTFLFLEHPPVITLGRGADDAHLLAAEDELVRAGAEVWETTRGGDITYHGPGQLVGYGILDLHAHGRDLGRYLRNLEEALIRLLARYGFEGSRREGLTGAWVGDRKVAAIGVRAERWCTSHGFALNVDPDLSHYEWIVPCGIRDYGVTSLAELLRERDESAHVPSLGRVAVEMQSILGEVFDTEFALREGSDLLGLELPEGAPLGGVRRRFPPAESPLGPRPSTD